LVAKGLRPNVVVAEGLQCGISEHHMRRPGTLSLSPGVFLAVLGDLIDSVCAGRLPQRRGNNRPCRGVWDTS
jgi:creatinine amidohydrolase/Fe(II)-dependent formamide hydrolase-like protein